MDPMNTYKQMTGTDDVAAMPVSREALDKADERQKIMAEASKLEDERMHHHNHRHRHHQQVRRRRRR